MNFYKFSSTVRGTRKRAFAQPFNFPSDFRKRRQRRIFPVAAADPIPLHGDQDADGVPHEVHGHSVHHLQVHAQQAFHSNLRVRSCR